jgi:nucleotide-binding universal stress UspA family protein
MFLLLFMQVNLAVMRLRRKMPDLDRGFVIPWYPAIPILGLVANAVLAVYLFSFSPRAWFVGLGWVLLGLLAYYLYFRRQEGMERPGPVLMEEVLVSRKYSVLVPVVDPDEGRRLGLIGAILAGANGGEVLALHVARVPAQLNLADGRLLLKQSRSLLETVIAEAKSRDVPVHTVVRLGRNVADAVRVTALENASNLILLGWPGSTGTAGLRFGQVIDPLLDDPPADVAVVRYRPRRSLRSILVPVAGGLNSRLAFKLALNMAQLGEEGPARIVLLHVLAPGAGVPDRIRAEQVFDDVANGTRYEHLQRRIVEGRDVAAVVLSEACACDLVIIGASGETLFTNLLAGNIPEQVATGASVTVIMVKHGHNRLHSFLRQTFLKPASRQLRPPVQTPGTLATTRSKNV